MQNIELYNDHYQNWKRYLSCKAQLIIADAATCVNVSAPDEKPRFRIRKLTPRECYRLMDVPEENIDRLLASGIAKSQHYKLAGNSIVVSCLYHIFKTLFTNEIPNNQQLSLF